MNRIVTNAFLLIALGTVGATSLARAEGPAEKSAPKNKGFAAIQSLAGTWVAVEPAKPGEKPMTVVFRPTSGGSAMMESMFPGADHEMVNMFTAGGQGVLVTHYCAMGNQPRMRLTSMDKGVLKFEFVDAGNLKSRDNPHMDGLEITIKDDHLIEKWSSYADGKSTSTVVFEFKRQK